MTYSELETPPLYKPVDIPAIGTAQAFIIEYLSSQNIKYLQVSSRTFPTEYRYTFELRQGRIAVGLRAQPDGGVVLIYMMGSDMSKQVAEWFWRALRDNGLTVQYPKNLADIDAVFPALTNPE